MTKILLKYLRFFLLLLGVAGVIIYTIMPAKKHRDCISAEENTLIYPYGDSASGVSFINVSPSSFSCELINENGTCGLGFSFEKEQKYNLRNWGKMDSLILILQEPTLQESTSETQLNEQPNLKEIVIKLFSANSNSAKYGNRNSLRPLLKELAISPNTTRYAIAFSDFYLPNWIAKDENELPKTRLFRIAGMEIFSGWKNPANTPLEFKTESICAEGVSGIPFVILVIYICLLVGIAIGVRIK